MIQVVV